MSSIARFGLSLACIGPGGHPRRKALPPPSWTIPNGVMRRP